MSEALGFFGGMVAMLVVWFITDGSAHSPYRRGYRQGFYDATKALLLKEEDVQNE